MFDVSVRIASSRSPYRRAGLTFEAAPGKTIAVLVVPLHQFDDAALAQVLDDPHLDAMFSFDGGGFVAFEVFSAMTADAVRQAEERLGLEAGRPDDDLDIGSAGKPGVAAVIAKAGAPVADTVAPTAKPGGAKPARKSTGTKPPRPRKAKAAPAP